MLPLYRTRAAVPELTERLIAALGSLDALLELVFVDDCCPEQSYEAIPATPPAGVRSWCTGTSGGWGSMRQYVLGSGSPAASSLS